MEGEAARSFLGNFDQAWGSGELADVTDAVASIVGAKEESDVDSFFGGGTTGFLENDIPGARRLRADLLFGGEVQMLGLPSTTEVGRRLPKEAFYRHLTLDAKTRWSFVDDIGAITVANSIKTATRGLADGEAVHEIMVVRLDLKGDAELTGAIGAIAAANPTGSCSAASPTGGPTWSGRACKPPTASTRSPSRVSPSTRHGTPSAPRWPSGTRTGVTSTAGSSAPSAGRPWRRRSPTWTPGAARPGRSTAGTSSSRN